jgi:hypothetical protein
MGTRFALVLSAALCLLGVARPAHAGELQGTIYTGGAPAANLAFSVEGRKEPVKTDQRGRYSVDLSPGKHVLVIKGQRVEVTVEKQGTKRDIRL